MKFKVGDRIRVLDLGHTGTVMYISKDGLYVKFDRPVKCHYQGEEDDFESNEAYVPPQMAELMNANKNEWEDLWDSAAKGTKDET